MIQWEAISAISTALASGVGIVTAIAAYVRYRASKDLEFQELRPFLIPSLVIQLREGQKRLYIAIRNCGDTPALNVRLDFQEHQVWNWVRQPDYPFLSPHGISAIGPKETLSYFLGEITDNNPLQDIEFRDIDVVVSCNHPVKNERLSNQLRMSLQDNRYMSRVES